MNRPFAYFKCNKCKALIIISLFTQYSTSTENPNMLQITTAVILFSQQLIYHMVHITVICVT